MDHEVSATTPAALVCHALIAAGVEVVQLWWAYVRLGGQATAIEVEAHLRHNLCPLTPWLWWTNQPPHFSTHTPPASTKENPMLDALEAQQARALQCALYRAGVTADQLWWHYFSLGGDAGPLEVEAYLHQILPLPLIHRELLDHAAYELTIY